MSKEIKIGLDDLKGEWTQEEALSDEDMVLLRQQLLKEGVSQENVDKVESVKLVKTMTFVLSDTDEEKEAS